MDPWVEKRLVNERLRENRWEEAAAELDRYLTFLRTCSAWWYADHSFGNQDLEKWTSCSEIGHVLETKDHVTICVESKRENMGAHDLSCGRWFPNGLWKERLL